MNGRLLAKLEKLKSTKQMQRVLLIGGNGQIGESLMQPLNFIYGSENVLFCDRTATSKASNYMQLDAMDQKAMAGVFREFKPDLVFHLVALLSGGEITKTMIFL